MTFSTASFHFPRSWTQVIQFLTLIWQMSCLTLSSHLYLGLPCDLLVRGFQLNIFLTVLVSGILCTWPNHTYIYIYIYVYIFIYLYEKFSEWTDHKPKYRTTHVSTIINMKTIRNLEFLPGKLSIYCRIFVQDIIWP